MFEVHVHRDGELIETYSVDTAAEVAELVDHWNSLDGHTCTIDEITDPESLDASPDDDDFE